MSDRSNDRPGGVGLYNPAARQQDEAPFIEVPNPTVGDSGRRGSPGAALTDQPRRGGLSAIVRYLRDLDARCEDSLAGDILAGLAFAGFAITVIWVGCFLDLIGVLQ